MLFRVLALLSLIFLLVSVYKGGKGVAEVIGEGKKGIWQAGSQKDRFDQQAVAGVLGVAFLIAATAVGLNAPDRDSSVLKRVETLEQDVRALDREAVTVERRLERRIVSLQRRLQRRAR